MNGSLFSLQIWPTCAAPRGDGVVGGGVERIDLAHGRLDHGLNLVGAGDGEVGVLDAELVEFRLGGLDLDVGVGLGGAVEQADLFNVGQHLLHHLKLFGDRGEIGGAGDVGAGLVVILYKAGGGVVGDGATHDGDIGSRCRGCLCGGRGDRVNEVDAVAHELRADGLAGRLVVLGVLLVELDVQTAFLEGLDKTFVGGVERAVLGELNHANGVGGARCCRAGGAAGGGAV